MHDGMQGLEVGELLMSVEVKVWLDFQFNTATLS